MITNSYMKLPDKISPNPLLSSVVDIRFLSNIVPSELLSSVVPILSKEFPNIVHSNIPFAIKGDPQFQFLAEYVFSNDKFSVSIDNNVISFENLGNYYGWSIYYELIKSVLKKLNPILKPSKIIRVAARYISLFNSPDKLSENIIISEPFQKLSNIVQKNLAIESSFIKEDFQIRLKVSQNGTVRTGLISKKGMYIDIDTAKEVQLPTSFNDDLFEIIGNTHFQGKSFFFNLLQPAFLNSLNPEYK